MPSQPFINCCSCPNNAIRFNDIGVSHVLSMTENDHSILNHNIYVCVGFSFLWWIKFKVTYHVEHFKVANFAKLTYKEKTHHQWSMTLIVNAFRMRMSVNLGLKKNAISYIYIHIYIVFVWMRHENMSPRIGSRVWRHESCRHTAWISNMRVTGANGGPHNLQATPPTAAVSAMTYPSKTDWH